MTSALDRHSRTIWLAVLLLTLGGVMSGLRLPVSLFPQIDYPRVVVSIDAGDRDAAQMEAEITRPAEIALRTIPGVTRLRSTTSRGSAEISLNFNWGHDMVAAQLATQGTLASIQTSLPPGTAFDVRRMDPTIFPVYGLSLTSRTLDQEALRQIAELQVRPALTSVAGVASVDVLGGSSREFEVRLDPAKMAALGVSATDVADALAKANVVSGAGKLSDRHRLYLVLVQNRLATPEDIAGLAIKSDSRGAGVVALGSVATVRPASAPSYTLVNSNGRNAVLINIRQAMDANSVQVVKDVEARMAALQLPPSVNAQPYYDQSELVTGAANAVRDAILIGALLAGLVLFVFLRSARLMAITALMLPAVLAATCLILFALGMRFDMMTLGGMAAAVGLVVDDAVVMLEHVMRRMQEDEGRTDPPALLDAAAEMGKPLLGSTGATIIVFVPLAFITGVTGGFFKALAITMVAALAISLLFARFAIPLLAARWLRESDVDAASRADGLIRRLNGAYEATARRVFARPGLFALTIGIGMAVAGYTAWNHVPSGFMPKMDEGGFVLDYKAQPGAALEDTDRLLRQVERIITATPEVSSYSRRTGLQLGGGLTEADEGDYFIKLKVGSRRPIDAVITDIRDRIEREVPGLSVETVQLMEDLIGDLTAVPQPIEVKLFGSDPAVLEKAAGSVGKALGQVRGVVEVIDGLRVAGDALSIHVDPGLAAQQGFDPETVARQVEAFIGGTAATQVRVGEQLLDVRVRGPQDSRARADQLSAMPLVAPDGHFVRLGQIARISIEAGQKQLTREDLAPFIDVTARLEGRDLGSAMKEIKQTVAGLNLPPSIRIEYGGLYAEQQRSFADLSLVFSAALLLSSLLLTFLFESVTWTVSAITTVLLSAAAVLCGLWITGIELDISALMGLTMVVGMVSELIIFFFAEIDRGQPVTIDALREAAGKRLRPILMSALIAVLTLSPLALGLSRGAGLQQPLATAIIFGLIAAVPLVLLFLPAMVTTLGSLRNQRGAPGAPAR